MAEAPRPRLTRRLLWVLPLLLLAAAAANWPSLTKVVRGERSLRSILYGREENPRTPLNGWRMPADTGAAGARVTVELFLIPGDPCHIDTAVLGQSLGTLDPARVRVRFVDNSPGKPGAARSEQLRLGCDQGLAINGKTKFRVPDPTSPGQEKTVFTSHNGAGMDVAVLYVVLDRTLKAAYGGRGLGMTYQEFSTRQQQAAQVLMAAAEAEAKARAEDAGARRR